MKSKAMVLKKFRSPLELVEFDIPTLKYGQILVKMSAAGVCGSDVHMWQGEDPRTPLPIILGHEGVGTVVEVKGNKNYVEGSKIKTSHKILWNRGIVCGKCYYCTVLKEPSLCPNRKVYGINMSSDIAPYVNGCYSEYIVLDANTDVFKIQEDIDPAILVSASCSGATTAHAFDMISNCIGQTIVIQGPGPIGVYSVAFSKALGASNIIVIGGSENRLDLCSEFGATHILNRKLLKSEEIKQTIMDITLGRGADVIVEAAGTRGAAKEGLQLLRMGGTYLSTGYAQPVGSESIDFYADVVRKNVTIKGVWVSDTSHTYKAMNLVINNKDLFSKMVTHRFSLENANEALNSMYTKEALKAVLEF